MADPDTSRADMTDSTARRDHLLDLAAAYCDATATAAEVAELESLIVGSEAARREFLAYALVHGQLPHLAAGRPPAASRSTPVFAEATTAAAEPTRGAAAAGTFPGPLWRAAAVLVLLAATAGGGAWLLGRSRVPAEAPLAVIAEVRFAVPADREGLLRVGRQLNAERIAINAGAMRLMLRNGVSIVLDGPADLELVSEMRAVLRDGSVVVRVPKGMSGFRVETPAAEVLDLGTEFAVRASRGQRTDVQVYEGAVVASHAANASGRAFPHRVEAGQAVRFSARPQLDPEWIPFEEARFLRALPPEPAEGEPYAAGSVDSDEFGTPSHDRLAVMPMSQPPTIDGQLDDWPQEGVFRAWYGRDPLAAEWVEGRMAYDATHLYIAARVGDPAPMRSGVDPAIDADKGWTGGGVQVRISTDRAAGWPVAGNSYGYYWIRNKPMLPTAQEKAAATNPLLNHLVMWHHAPTGRACLSLASGMTHDETVGDPPGYQGAFAKAADGKGYVLEYAIPWPLLGAGDDPPQAGDVLAVAWQVHFADLTGRVWRRQIIEIRNLEEPYRIGVWQRAATWGKAEYR